MILIYITDIVFIISTFISCIFLYRKYTEGLEDGMAISNFLIGAVLLVISFTTYLICDIFSFYTSQLALSLHILDTLIFFIQCRGAILINNFFYKEKNINTNIVGIIFMIIFMLIISSIGLFVTCNYTLLNSKIGLQGLQITGMKTLDGYIELLHAVFCCLIFAFLPFGKKLLLLKCGFLFIGISEITQILNIMSFSYTDSLVFNIEWFFAVIGILCINGNFIYLYKHQNSYYYFID